MMGRVLFCALLLAGVATAVAHPSLSNTFWVLLEPGRVRVAVNVSVREITLAQGVADGAEAAALTAAVEKHRAYVAAHLHISAGGEPLTGRVVKITEPPLLGDPEKTFYQYELEYPVAAPGEITLGQDMLREYAAPDGTPWDISYLVRLKRAADTEPEALVLPSRQVLRLPAAR
jgi:hypothetical protein